MADESVSLLLQVWQESNNGGARLRALRIDGQPGTSELRFKEGTFLLRIAVDQGRMSERCFIRHIPTAREAYVQGGSSLRAFIQDCLLDRASAQSTVDTQPL